MTQEDKQLLLVDLCARLPYNVKCEGVTYADYNDIKDNYESEKVTGILSEIHYYKFECIYVVIGLMDECPLETVKPYLRPMSSMTREELHEVQEILGKGVEIRKDFILSVDSSINSFTYLELIAVFNWLNAHHFDYRGLIPKGLAIEAPEGMYNNKEELQ